MCEVFELSSFKLMVPPQKAFVQVLDQKALMNRVMTSLSLTAVFTIPKGSDWNPSLTVLSD